MKLHLVQDIFYIDSVNVLETIVVLETKEEKEAVRRFLEWMLVRVSDPIVHSQPKRKKIKSEVKNHRQNLWFISLSICKLLLCQIKGFILQLRHYCSNFKQIERHLIIGDRDISIIYLFMIQIRGNDH